MLFRTLLVAVAAAVAIGTACWVVSNQPPADWLPTAPQAKVQPQAIYGAFEVRAEITGYCKNSCCCGPWAEKGVNSKDERVTASQHVIRPDDKFFAAPKNIPFGTMIEVEGYGRFPVEDRGGAIVGNCIDLYFCDKDGVSGHQRAKNWGRKQMKITIWRPL